MGGRSSDWMDCGGGWWWWSEKGRLLVVVGWCEDRLLDLRGDAEPFIVSVVVVVGDRKSVV